MTRIGIEGKYIKMFPSNMILMQETISDTMNNEERLLVAEYQKLAKDLDETIEGKNVIVIEDIIDSGRTLSYLLEILAKRNPNSMKLCALLDKPERRVKDVKVDYVGFAIPDEFVVGYGLDYAQKYRNLPYIGVVHGVE